MKRETGKRLTAILKLTPYALFAWAGNRGSWAFRTINGDMTAKVNKFFDRFIYALTVNFLPSFNLWDLSIGLVVGVGIWFYLYDRKKNAKKLRVNREHGSAEWGTAKDIEPYIDFENPDNNIILTQTEQLTMKSGNGALDRNKNVMVVGGAGTGKTLFVVKPNIMQMHSSVVVTDPKGGVIKDTGKMLEKKRYKIKVFNTVNFAESMHYNPFSYFRKDQLQEDIRKFITVFMANTGDKSPGGDEFWNKAEVLLYTAYIALIFTIFPESDRNMSALVEMVTRSQVSEDTKSEIDISFEATEKWLNGEDLSNYKGLVFPLIKTKFIEETGRYAINYYKRFRQAAGKTMKSILISCSSRLSMFDIKAVQEITSRDDLELDKIGDEKTAFFIIISDTNSTFNFLVSIMYAQIFDLLCDKAYASPGNRLKHHVRFILDEFSNIGQIPDFEKKISVFRSREMSATIIIQAMSQLKATYKESADTILANCDSTLFLGSSEMPTLEWVSKMLGKETIDTRNYSVSESSTSSGSFSRSEQKAGRELMTPDELRVMDGGKCILLIRGIKPFFSNKFNYFGHKRIGLVAKDGKNEFIIEKKINRKLIVKQEDEYILFSPKE